MIYSGGIHVSSSLNCFEGGFIGQYMGKYSRGIKGDTRGVDNG